MQIADCRLQIEELDGPRPIRREELVASRRLAALCFPGFVEELGEEQVASYSPPRRGGTQVICHRGVPVSQISIFHSRVNVYGSNVGIASIGGVCTHPNYRGKGLATRLLDYCIHKLTAEGARLLLISGKRKLYQRAGCVTAQDFEYIALKRGEGRETLPLHPPLHPKADGLSLRPATAGDAPLCARLYQMEAVHFVRRVGEFTEHFCQPEEFPKAEDWIVEVRGQPVAYLFLSLPWECWHEQDMPVQEVVEYAGNRVALVGGLAKVMARLGLRELRLLVPWQDVDFFQFLRGQNVTGDRIPLIGHTMRIVNFPGLMSDLGAYIRSRLTGRLRRGLRFQQERLALSEAEGDRYAIVQGRERFELDGAAMTRLVMGVPAGMAAEGPTSTVVRSGALGEVVSALFPLPSLLPGLNFR